MPDIRSPHGAPMGREEWTEYTGERVRCFRLRMVDGDYDDGGAYWGGGCPYVYCALSDSLRLFVRATSRDEAKAKLIARKPGIRWVN
jgi:hypothetical protein